MSARNHKCVERPGAAPGRSSALRKGEYVQHVSSVNRVDLRSQPVDSAAGDYGVLEL